VTYKPENTAITQLTELLTNGQDSRFLNALELLVNTAMLLEQREHLRVEPYERSDERNGQANGFKDRSFGTRLGNLNLRIPQVRGGDDPFYPNSLDKGLRSERALKLAVAEMYVQGVSTRKVAAITEELCGINISSAQVSRAAAELDVMLSEWRNRELGQMPYVILDARYEKVRQDGVVRDAAVLVAIGIGMDGKRSVIGCSVAISEHETHWRAFLMSLVERGLRGVELITSDAHSGLEAARKAVFGGVAWQRCQFHLQQNAQSYVPKQDMKSQVAADIRDIYNAKNRAAADATLAEAVRRYSTSAPKLAAWMEASIPEGLTVFSLPNSHRRLLRTSNGLERVNREIRRRTRVATLFPNEASCLRLVTAVLMEISDEWEAGKVYLSLPHQQI